MAAVSPRRQRGAPSGEQAPAGRGGHRRMIACCISLLLVVAALIPTGVVSASDIVFAVICLVMMAVMMLGINRGGDNWHPTVQAPGAPLSLAVKRTTRRGRAAR